MMTESNGLQTPGQRGFVALLFADICDYTQLAELLDPEDVGSIKRQLQDIAEPLIAAQGGELVQSYGDGILAVFGFAAACEDCARRAIAAALDLHERVQQTRWACTLPTDRRVDLHTGIHTGLVFARSGDLLNGRYDLSGDAVNTAARLCSIAQRDEIVASTAAIRGCEEFFVAQAPRSVALKGKREPLAVVTVSGRTEARTRFEASTRRGLTSFVGRDVEFDQLQALRSAQEQDWGRLGLVVGPAGVGKTRLLEELRALQQRADVNVLFGSCDNYSELAPLAPFLQVLRQALGLRAALPRDEAIELLDARVASLGPALRAHLPTLMGLLSLAPWTKAAQTDGSIDRNAVAAVTDVLHRLSAERTLLLMLDDWQWADDASRALLSALRQHAPERGDLCVVIGMRALERNEQTLRPQLVVELPPFDEEESQVVVRHLLPHEGGTELSKSLYNLSGGNPLFLEELCRLMPATLSRGVMPEIAEIPATLQGVIHTRLANLPLEQAELLRVAAVVGIEFSSPVLAELSGSDHLDELLRALRHEDLIYATSDTHTFRFKHGVARDVIYETVLRAERRRLHGAIAHLIAQSVAANSNSDQSESLAYHYAGSDDHARAAMYSALAGEKALHQSSLDRARFHFAAALAALDKLPQDRETKQRWLELSMRWAEPSAYSPRRENIQVMERAALLGAELGDVNAQCRSGYWLGWFYFVLGDYANSIEAHQRALDLASVANDHRMVAQLWSNLGQVYGAAGEYSEALPLLTRGLESKKNRGQSQSLTRAVGYAHAMACKGLLHSDRGEFDLVDQHFSAALEVVQGSNHPMEASILSQQCLALLRRGEWSLCAEASQRSMRAAERKGIPFLVAQSRFFHGFARFMQEPKHEWIERMRRALDWLDLMEQGLYSSFLYACTADAYLSLHETALAAEFSGRALRRVEKRDLLGEAAGYRVLARLSSLREGVTYEQTDAALTGAFRAAEARKSPREHILTSLLQAELWLERGEHERAYLEAEAAKSEFTRMRMSFYEQRASRIAALATSAAAPTHKLSASL